MFISSLILLALAASGVSASHSSPIVIKGSIHSSIVFREPSYVLLNGGGANVAGKAFITENNEFEFTLGGAGNSKASSNSNINVLDFVSREFMFNRIRVTILKNGSLTYSPFNCGWDFDTITPPLPSLDNIMPVGRMDYFTPHPTFNVWSLFANPMLLMSAVTLGMVFIIPRMKDAITDPEIIKEMEERSKKRANGEPVEQLMPNIEMPDISAALSDWMVGGSKKETPKASSSSSSSKGSSSSDQHQRKKK